MSILTELSALCAEAFNESGFDGSFGSVVPSQRPDLSQFQCNGALPAAKSAGANPRELAHNIAEKLSENSNISSVEVAGPGFININASDEFLASTISHMASANSFGAAQNRDGYTLVDYGGANIAKSLHVGHLRVALIGESLKRTYRFAGYRCDGDVHLGDWGLPMGQLIAIVAEKQPELPYFDELHDGPYPSESPVTVTDLERLYPEAANKAAHDGDFAEKARLATVALQDQNPGYYHLWKHFRDISVGSLRSSYTRLGVEFEKWLGEASVADRITKMIDRLTQTGTVVESDGAQIIKVAEPEDTEEIPPLILLNSRGGLTYATTDLATIEERVDDFGFNRIVYVVDARQSLHFRQVFRAAFKSKLADATIELTHAATGTVNGPDGKPFKTRAGNIPRLDDLIDESKALAMAQLDENDLALTFDQPERERIASLVGIAALAYGELSNHRMTNYNFDLERFTQLKGQTGPYLQYVVVRARSTMAKAAESAYMPGEFAAPTEPSERELILKLLWLPETIERCLESNSPNIIAEYAYTVAQAFNVFYDNCHILSAPNDQVRESWLALVDLAANCLAELCDLLCIPIPDRM